MAPASVRSFVRVNNSGIKLNGSPLNFIFIVSRSVAACVQTVKVGIDINVKLELFILNHILSIFFEIICWLIDLMARELASDVCNMSYLF